MSIEDQALSLRVSITNFSQNYSITAIEKFEEKSHLVLLWLSYFEQTLSNNVCDELLRACRSAQIEAAACLSVGFVRSAMFAMRLQFELLLAWLYFNDHAIEWDSTSSGENDFPMRRQNIQYMEKFSPRFKARFQLLSQNSLRTDKEPYRTLSSFVHGSSIFTMPQLVELSTVVQDEAALSACLRLQNDVSEYLADISMSWLANRWVDLPDEIRANVTTRLSASQVREFCRSR